MVSRLQSNLNAAAAEAEVPELHVRNYYSAHRAEYWVVVRGHARVTIGDEIKLLHENESIYIPLGASHRVENPGKIELELIEVQTGSYLGEDDIVRIDDDFRRS